MDRSWTVRRVVLAAALLAFGGGPPLAAAPEVEAVVPDVTLRTLPEAAAFLVGRGVNIERYYEVRYPESYQPGLVIQQNPKPGAVVKFGAGVMLRVMAAQDGPPEGRLPDPSWPRYDPLPAPKPPTSLWAPSTGARGGSEVAPLAPVLPPVVPEAPTLLDPVPPPLAPEPTVTPPLAPVPAAPLPAPEPPRTPEPLPDVAHSGSPDAPVVAERGKPGEVPDLRGLPLADAEQRAREAELELYVERVPGHPVGRVVEQVPSVGQRRSKGSIVRVTVTAGGDYDGEQVPVPTVDVPRVMVPDLLDRTPPQAERILDDLGLVFQREEARSGQPGRVVDQKPAAGSVVAKGSVVRLWIMPAVERAPAPPGPPAEVARGTELALPAPAPTAPAPPAPAPSSGASAAGGGVPAPIAPSEGTLLPKQRTLALGFSWLPVEGADAYLLEVEERGPSGWLGSVRKPARAAATTVELERVAPTAAEIRWRVRAVIAGREGTPSAWVTLR